MFLKAFSLRKIEFLETRSRNSFLLISYTFYSTLRELEIEGNFKEGDDLQGLFLHPFSYFHCCNE